MNNDKKKNNLIIVLINLNIILIATLFYVFDCLNKQKEINQILLLEISELRKDLSNIQAYFESRVVENPILVDTPISFDYYNLGRYWDSFYSQCCSRVFWFCRW
jgi:hypothetical protein